MRSSSLVIAGLSLVLAVSLLHGQQSTEMKMDRHGMVEAGSTITFTVTLDKSPNIDAGGVQVNVAPVQSDPNAPGTAGAAGASNPERTIYKVPVRVPINARSGEWHVTGLSLSIPSAPGKTLKFNEVSFQVKEKEHVVLPDSGLIEISK